MPIQNDLTSYFTLSYRSRHPESELAKAVALDELHQLLDESPYPRIKLATSKALDQLEPSQQQGNN